MGGEAGRAPSGGLRSCACSRTGWGLHHHTTTMMTMVTIINDDDHDDDDVEDENFNDDDDYDDGQADESLMIPGCKTLGRSRTAFNFSDIFSTFSGSSASVLYWFMWRVVNYRTVIHDVFGCLFHISASSTDVVYCASYSMQPVLEMRVMATSQSTQRHLLFS